MEIRQGMQKFRVAQACNENSQKWILCQALVCSNLMQCFHRKDVRELGMTLVINGRKKPPPLHLYKALLMAQVKT